MLLGVSEIKIGLNSKLSLGVELGSTRIKAVLVAEDQEVVASGSFEWENQLENGFWTYSLDSVWQGLQSSYAELKQEVKDRYGFTLSKITAIGFSAMMHGYLAFDQDDQLLVPFRTWRNATTAEAQHQLTELLGFNIPQRWSIAHLYQAMLNGEEHVKDIAFFTTLAGYVHWKLTGEKVLGVGDASGMFPIDAQTKDYNSGMMSIFDEKVSTMNYPLNLKDIIPKVLVAGEKAGELTKEGALLLDPAGDLGSGVPLCPPEGDAGTGMVATNSVKQRTGNISAGTSVFAMIVLESELSKVYPEIDMVTTPKGDAVAMVHANNCSSEINAWVKIFREFLDAAGIEMSTDQLYQTLFTESLKGDMDAGGILSYGYLSGENITKVPEGRPLLVRSPNSNFNLANLMRVNLYTAFGALHLGMKTLTDKERVRVDQIFAHGGIFKTEGVAQQILASAINTPIAVMETAGEGGAWGIALLADYLEFYEAGLTLEDYLEDKVFANEKVMCREPIEEEVAGYEVFARRYEDGLAIEMAAVESFDVPPFR